MRRPKSAASRTRKTGPLPPPAASRHRTPRSASGHIGGAVRGRRRDGFPRSTLTDRGPRAPAARPPGVDWPALRRAFQPEDGQLQAYRRRYLSNKKKPTPPPPRRLPCFFLASNTLEATLKSTEAP